MRTCREYEELISAFIDGVLPEEERVELMEHMARCPVCQAYFDDQIAIHDAMEQLEDVPAPADFSASVMAQVRETPQDLPRQKKSVSLWRRWASAGGALLAACCAIAVLGAWHLWGGTRFASQSVTASSAADTAAPEEALMDEADCEGELPALQEARMIPEEEFVTTDDAPREESAPAPEAAPAPALASPKAMDDAAAVREDAIAENTAEGAKMVDHTAALATSSPVAGAWVEEHLGLAWTSGERYELTAEEYAALRTALEEAGETFTEETSGVWLLIAE